MTTQKQLRQQIVEAYTEATPTAEMSQAISKYFSGLKPSQSKDDPHRLGTQSTFISKLRDALLEKVGGMEVDNDQDNPTIAAFNKMTAKQQVQFQKKAVAMDNFKWVQTIEIMPKNIRDLKMSTQDSNKLKQQRTQIDTAKLREKSVEIDGDRMIEKLCPILLEENPKKEHLAAALLLVTGRRTVEMLKTGDFYLGKNGSADGYTCMFSGQAKTRGGDYPPFEIPLLTPYSVVKKAFNRLRALYSETADMDNVTVNSKFSNTINHYLARMTGLTAHGMRGAYAMMAYAMLQKGLYTLKIEEMSLMGFISQVLGHSNTSSASAYQRLKVINFTGPYVPKAAEEPVDVEGENDNGWDVSGAAERKRLAVILEMIEKRLKLTASSIRAYSGGATMVINRVLAKNADRVSTYNESL